MIDENRKTVENQGFSACGGSENTINFQSMPPRLLECAECCNEEICPWCYWDHCPAGGPLPGLPFL